MATATVKTCCITCGKGKAVMKCGGCSQDFCFNHMTNHRQELSKQLDEIEMIRDVFRQTLTEQTSQPQKHVLMQQIDQWEHDSINKIRGTAEEARNLLLKCTTGHFNGMEVKLDKLTEQLRESRQENDFIEADLQNWKQQLEKLKDELNKPSTITISHELTPLVTKICVNISGPSYASSVTVNAKWIQNGITVAGGNGSGSGLNQLSYPNGIYVDDDQTIYVADWSNNRVVEWKNGATSGRVVAGGNGLGNRNDQLNGSVNIIIDRKTDSLIIGDYNNQRVMQWPRQNGRTGEIIISNVNCYGSAMDNDEYLYISDYVSHEVKRWKIGETDGTVVAGGNGRGDGLNQLNRPSYIFIDQDHSVYVSDSGNNRVMKWMKGAKEGIVVAGGHGTGNDLTQLSAPYGVLVDQLGTVYVVDNNNHRVMRWYKGAAQGSVIIGGNGQGEGIDQLSHPRGLSFDRQGNLYVAGNTNHRVQRFNIDPNSNK